MKVLCEPLSFLQSILKLTLRIFVLCIAVMLVFILFILLMIVLIFAGLFLISMGLDRIANPRLWRTS